MSWLGIYFVVVYILGICASFYYAGHGGTYQTPKTLVFSAFWSLLNMVLLILFGVGPGVL